MSTIQFRSRTVHVATFCLRLGAVIATIGIVAGVARMATAAPTGTLDENTEVRSAAAALAPAQRLSMDPTKPIFPMQITPVCYILDNFGDGRSGGRVHLGTDMMATLGQEVYAVVDGTLGRQVIDGEAGSSLSGNTWRLTTTGNPTWYAYMHLSGFAPGLINGSVVTQGQLIGYVGDTGNPGPGNYHLHFEVHPNGGAAVNALSVLTVPTGCTVQR